MQGNAQLTHGVSLVPSRRHYITVHHAVCQTPATGGSVDRGDRRDSRDRIDKRDSGDRRYSRDRRDRRSRDSRDSRQ